MPDTNKISRPSKQLWSDYELQIALDAYMYLLRLEKQGVELTTSEISALLVSIPLPIRNESSLRYRFRNISHVLEKLDMPYLQAFSPAEKLGAKVEARLIEIIKSYESMDYILLLEQDAVSTDASNSKDNSDILNKLEILERRLSEAEKNWPAQIGHNNPPDAIQLGELSRGDIKDARTQTEFLEQEFASTKPSTPVVKSVKNRLLAFGMKLSLWLGGRFTKFVDAALKIYAPVFVAQLTNVLPALLDVIRALSNFLAQ